MTAVNLDIKANLYKEIASGRIWSGPSWAVEKAINAINAGECPVPAYIPDQFRGYITTDAPASDIQPVEPMGGPLG